ncbi:MAG: dihydroorotate dehydrogenase electron transfer subunit [Eubacteriales bacterium]|nr:dihydroorotate dehydrogenase electron transfer subunit [Eubacteriales bacterium]
MKIKETAVIVSQKQISEGIYDLVLKTPTIASQAVPGQFVNVFTPDKSKLLPRPISLCGIDAEEGTLRLVYRAGGEGTKILAGMQPGETLELLGPLGNGFPLEEAAGKRVYLIGGGIGVPPLLQTAKALKDKAEVISVMGYRSDCFLREDFEAVSEMLIATEDGSTGTKGNVMDAIAADGRVPEVIFACGPAPMLRALKAYALERNIPCWLSMEERMACGIGACLACVCKTTEVDAHSQVHNTRVCKDGPVFPAQEIEI